MDRMKCLQGAVQSCLCVAFIGLSRVMAACRPVFAEIV